MAARAMWKGTLVVGSRRVGVKLYAAVADRDVHLHLLHEPDGVRVRQRMAHPETDETVAAEDTRRGVEVERGRFVVLDDEELASLEPEPSRDIELVRFVPRGVVDHRWYERPYYLGPDQGQAHHYAALAAALEDSEREGIATWTMRKREYIGALRLHEGVLALVSLRHAEEVVVAADLPAPEGRELDERELALASQLVGALSGTFEHARFRDEYRDALLELVETKRRGKKVKLERFRQKPSSDASLLTALKKSLKRKDLKSAG